MRQLIYAVSLYACYMNGKGLTWTHSPPPPPYLYLFEKYEKNLHSCGTVAASRIFGLQTKLICVFMIMIHETRCFYVLPSTFV